MLDHVVEDLGRRQQQPPVEAHRTARRAARPARALAADLQRAVAPARAGHGRVEPRRHLDRAPARYQASSALASALPGPSATRSSEPPPRDVRARRATARPSPAAQAARPGTEPRRRRTAGRAENAPPTPSCGGASARSMDASPGRMAQHFAEGNGCGTTTSTPSASTWIRACRARFERLIRYGRVVTRTRLGPRSAVGHSSTYLRSGRGAPTTTWRRRLFPYGAARTSPAGPTETRT